MKALVTIFVLLFGSLAAHAADCETLDLQNQAGMLRSMEGLSPNEAQLYFQKMQKAKLSQILGCVAISKSITAQDAEFAERMLLTDLSNRQREYLNELRALQIENRQSRNGINYQRNQTEISKLQEDMQRERENTRELIKKIKESVRN